LAAIMFTDMVGYTALGQRNESLSLALVEEQRKLIRPILTRHNGREVKTMGDAFLVAFPNATDSVSCAYDIQRAIREFNLALASDKRIHLRIGIHLGEVVESQGDISGDAVNVASRIEPLAEDGGVCITRQVYDQVSNKTDLQMTSLGAKPLKNVSVPIEVYKMEMPWEQPTPSKEAATTGRDRIAILPFANMSPDPNDEYFADGMTEEIISTVSGISGLSVISRTSIMGYKGTSKKVKEIGKELEVGAVLEGSFRKAGNSIRVTTQLIDVAGDRHLWAQNYDRELDNVFAVQSDIAQRVADALKVKILTPEKERIEKKPTESSTAYALCLKGKYYMNKRGLEDLKKALKYFELSIHEDPDFALGYVGVSDSCAILRSNWDVEREAYLERAKAMLDKALELDSGLAEARASRAALLYDEYNLRQAEEEFKRAIELKPSYASAHMWYCLLLMARQRWNEAQEQIEKTIELDPLSPAAHTNHGGLYLWKRDYSKAIEPFSKAIELGYTLAHWGLAWVYGRMKKFDDMKRELAAWVELNKELVPFAQLSADINSAYLIDDKKMVSRLLPELKSHFNDDRGPDALAIAGLCFYLGEREEGFEWLERSYSRKEWFLLFIEADDHFDGIRTDPRYLDLVKRLGLD
ncbi:MAG TPA: adenylate/guanylate cyclase domain-containing protein, partial [Candidatus Acidoferrum sp.]|nr:adenylate/guanylate cyclase domain-containing protein [Candidatus Acidoferrum sp.]